MNSKDKTITLDLIKAFGFARVARAISRHHPLILMWHRVSHDEFANGVTAKTFRRQIELLVQHRNVISLDTLMNLTIQKQEIPPNVAVITFDDGYGDFYEIAHPIIESYALPSTVFITTDFVDGKQWMWPDKIRYILANRKAPGAQIEVKALKSKFSSELVAWNAVADKCLEFPDEARDQFLEEFSNDLGVSVPEHPTSEYRSLTWSEVAHLHRRGVQIGSHSVSHPVMTKLSNNELAYELNRSRELISGFTGIPTTAFCYPYGSPNVVNQSIIEAIQAAGYDYAVVATKARWPLRNRWAVNRYGVGESMYEFEKVLHGFKYIQL